jgi:hypothetical protein
MAAPEVRCCVLPDTPLVKIPGCVAHGRSLKPPESQPHIVAPGAKATAIGDRRRWSSRSEPRSAADTPPSGTNRFSGDEIVRAEGPEGGSASDIAALGGSGPWCASGLADPQGGPAGDCRFVTGTTSRTRLTWAERRAARAGAAAVSSPSEWPGLGVSHSAGRDLLGTAPGASVSRHGREPVPPAQRPLPRRPGREGGRKLGRASRPIRHRRNRRALVEPSRRS